MNLFQTTGTHPSTKQSLKLSAVHMPLKMATDSTYHYRTLNPTIKNHCHSQNSALHIAEVKKKKKKNILPCSAGIPQKLYLCVESSLAIKRQFLPPPPSGLFGGELLSLLDQVEVAPNH